MASFQTLFWVIVPFLIMLGVLIFFHELGHFIFAKIFRCKVLHFALGFGPWLVSKKIGETEYGIKWIPFGGSVRVFGDPTEMEELGEEISPEERKRALFAQPAWKKLLIFSAGSLMNILLAFAVSPVVYWKGIERPYIEVAPPRVGAILPDSPAEQAGIKPGDLILQVNSRPVKTFQQLITNEMLNPGKEMVYKIQRGNEILVKKIKLARSKEEGAGYSGIILPGSEPIIGRVQPGSPAEKAGLKPDDKILAVNGQAVKYWHELSELIQKSQGNPIKLLVERAGRKLELVVEPKYNSEHNRYLIGIVQKEVQVFVRYGFWEGLKQGIKETIYWAGLTLRVAEKLFSAQLSIKAVSGPVGIAGITSQAAQMGLSHFLRLLVIISINLGILNLLPIPPLDGAHILVTTIEAIIRRQLSQRFKEAIFQTGFILLIGFMLLVTFNDFLRFREPIINWFKELFKQFGY